MGFSARSLVLPLALALGLASSASFAQSGTATGPTPPPPGGGAPAAGAPATGGGAGPAAGPGRLSPDSPAAGGTGAAPAGDSKSTGNVGGVSFNDKPIARRQPTGRVFHRASGPLATFPGYEQLPDGGSRLFVQLNQTVPVEERRAQGSVTYVLRGAHLRVHNDSNALVTVHFNTPVFRAKLTPQGNDLLFILELRAAATPTFKIAENTDKTSTLQIDFAKGDFINGDGTETIPATRPVPSLGRTSKRGAQKPAQPAAPAATDPNGTNP